MRFRLTWFDTDNEDKWTADNRYEYLGNAQSIFRLWFTLTHELHAKHIDVFMLDGSRCDLRKGIEHMFSMDAGTFR